MMLGWEPTREHRHVQQRDACNLVPVMALIEIVRGLQTTDATHDRAEAIVLQLGKIADYRQKRAWIPHRLRIAVDDQRGFLRARRGRCQRDGNRRGHDAR